MRCSIVSQVAMLLMRPIVAGFFLLLIPATPLRPAAAADQSSQLPENIAIGKQYKLWPSPHYSYCTDPGDATQLTDGKTTKNYFWTQKSTVGWTNAPYVTITVDLGKDEPIGGVAFDTAAGVAGVEWPAEIDILVSSDGKTYRNAGELIALDEKLHGPWPKGYGIRRLLTNDLKAHGRFVQFVVISKIGSPFTFCDEVEIFRGPSVLLTQESGPQVSDAKSFFRARRLGLAVLRRYESDAAALEAAIRNSHRTAVVQSRLLGQLNTLRGDLRRTSSEAPPPSRVTLPFGSEHERLFALQAELWRETGCPLLSASVPSTWDPVPLVGLPPKAGGEIEVHLMRGEYRAAAVNLAYCGPRPLQVAVSFDERSPGSSILRKAIRFHAVPWTDTSPGEPVAAALPEVSPVKDGTIVAAIPGLISQIWLNFHVDGQVPAGEYRGDLILKAPDGDKTVTQRVPIRLHVYPIDFPNETTLCLGGWCYTDGKGGGGVTSANRTAFIEHLREHFVNCPWAGSGVMMQCKFPAGDVDKVELDTQNMDQWLGRWPGAKRYMVFLSVGPSLGGVKFDSPAFPRRVKAWIAAWVGHLRTKGVSPESLCLLIHDEPNESSDVGPLVAWARAIHAAEPKVVIWEDPTYRDPAKAPAEVFEVSQVLCPNRPMWLAGGDKFAQFYLDQQRRGRMLQFYSCSGPARLLDPYSYYRLQAWHCWQIGATGSSFWSFGDNGGSSSWNEYMAAAGPFTPLFLDDTSVVAGKQMEAIRESVEDYEYFVMLRAAVARAKAGGRTGPEIGRAESLLSDGARQVLAAPDADKLFWHDPKDRSRADAVRIEILKLLTALNR